MIETSEIFLRLGVAALLTALVGIERELRGKPAGLRTNVVVGVASAGFSLAGAVLIETPDPTRVAAQVVSGIGFLGGGAIFAAGGQPQGLTTAAALWASAAIGLAAGFGSTVTALAIVAVTVGVLWPLDIVMTWMEKHIRRRHRITVMMDNTDALDSIHKLIKKLETDLVAVELRAVGNAVLADLVIHGNGGDVRKLGKKIQKSDGLRLPSGLSVL